MQGLDVSYIIRVKVYRRILDLNSLLREQNLVRVENNDLLI